MRLLSKTIALALSIILMVSLMITSCGGAAATTTTTTTKATTIAAATTAATTAAATSATKNYSFGFSVKTLTNPFFVKLKEAIEANLKPGDKLVTFDTNYELNRETSIVEDMIVQKYDAIFITCIDIKGSIASIDKMLAAKIPVCILDSPTENRDKVNFSVISDNVQAGYNAMKGLAEAIPKGSAVVFYDNITSAATADRMKGRDQYITENPGCVNVVKRQSGAGKTDLALDAMSNFLQSNPEIKGAWSMNDAVAQGMVAACKASGKKAGDVKIASIDGSAEGAKLIQDGWQLGSSAQYPTTMGKTGIVEMYKVLAGGSPSKQDIRIATEWIDSKNVATYKAYNMQ